MTGSWSAIWDVVGDARRKFNQPAPLDGPGMSSSAVDVLKTCTLRCGANAELVTLEVDLRFKKCPCLEQVDKIELRRRAPIYASQDSTATLVLKSVVSRDDSSSEGDSAPTSSPPSPVGHPCRQEDCNRTYSATTTTATSVGVTSDTASSAFPAQATIPVSTSAAPTSEPSSSGKGGGGLSRDAKIAIGAGVGGGVLLLIALIVGFLLWRKRRNHRSDGAKYLSQPSYSSMAEVSRVFSSPLPPQAVKPRELGLEEEQYVAPIGYDLGEQYQPYQHSPEREVFHTPVSALTPSQPHFSFNSQVSPVILTTPGPDATPQSSIRSLRESLHESSRESSPERATPPISPISPVSAISPSSSRPPSLQHHE